MLEWKKNFAVSHHEIREIANESIFHRQGQLGDKKIVARPKYLDHDHADRDQAITCALADIDVWKALYGEVCDKKPSWCFPFLVEILRLVNWELEWRRTEQHVARNATKVPRPKAAARVAALYPMDLNEAEAMMIESNWMVRHRMSNHHCLLAL